MSEIPLHFKTITEVSELIREKNVSPVEVTTAILDRIDQLDSRPQKLCHDHGGPRDDGSTESRSRDHIWHISWVTPWRPQ